MLNISKILPLKTKHLIIRKTLSDDVYLLLKQDKQELTQLFLVGVKDKTLEERITFINQKIKNNELGESLSITVCIENETPIGFVDLKLDNKTIKISYIFDYDYCNNGYCTEACNKLIEVIFNKTNIKEIVADTIEGNISSMKVLQKLNFKIYNIRKNAAYVKSLNNFLNFYDYKLTKEDNKKEMVEYRDLYDKNRKLTGEKIKKGDKVPKGKYYVTVVVWIENSKQEFLLQINKKYNKWAPTGGHPKSGETSLDGIITEIKEELGINLKKNELTLFKTVQTEDDFVDLYYLKKDIDLKILNIQEEEVGDVKWFSKEEIEKLIDDNIFLESHIETFNYCLEFIK